MVGRRLSAHSPIDAPQWSIVTRTPNGSLIPQISSWSGGVRMMIDSPEHAQRRYCP
jgi:hypothetical protein